MKKSSSFLFGRLFGLFVLIASLFMSCNIGVGLGEDVDTTAPTADIEYPPSSAVIRGTFLLAGTCEDDKGLKEILVTVRNPENTDQSYGPYKATIDDSQKSWSILLNQYEPLLYLNNNGWEYLDGKYEVIVVAYDKAGRDSGERSRTFEIDNTAPFFVISNPGVVKSQKKDPSTYGSVFNIEGTIADDHTVSSMAVNILNSEGEVITTEPLVEEAISTAGGTSVTFAKYSDTAEAEVNKRYSFVYNANTAADAKGTKSYYCSVSLTDNAKLYTNIEDAEGVGPGNTTSNVYLYDLVYSTLISSKNGGLGLSAADLNKIYNRTVTNENALLLLRDSVIDTSASLENSLCFTLNPQANPTYVVSGLQFDYSGESLQKMSPNQTMTIALNAGLDNTNVDPSTIKVWMLEYNVGELANVPKQATVLNAIQTLATKVKELEKEDAEAKEKAEEGKFQSKFVVNEKTAKTGDWLLLLENSSYNGATVSSTTVSVTIPSGKVDLGNFYIIAVTGYDADKVELLQDTVYGFEGNTEGVPPTTAIVSPAANSYFAKSDDVEFKGTAILSKSGIYINDFKATLTRTNEDNPEDTVTITEELSKASKNEAFKGSTGITYNDETGEWAVTPKNFAEYEKIVVEQNKGVSYTYNLEFEAASSSGHSAIVSRLSHIDTISPVVEFTGVTPTVLGATKTNINGKITISGRVNEVNLDHVDYETYVDGVKIDFEGYSGTFGKANNFSHVIDTTKLTIDRNGKDFEFKVIAYDTNNNIGSYTSTEYNKGSVLYIDQETDRPKFEFNNIEMITDTTPAADQIRESHNLFGTKSNYKLSFAVTDDKALSKVVVKLFKKDYDPENHAETDYLLDNARYTGDTNFNTETKTYTLPLAGTTASCQYALPETEGDYKVLIEVYDETYAETGISDTVKGYRKNTTGIFNVAVDSGAPSIFLTKPREGSYETENITAEGTITKTKGVTITTKVEKEVGGNFQTVAEYTSETISAARAATPEKVQLNESTKAWTHAFTLPGANAAAKEGNYKLTYTATDAYQQTAEVSTNIIVDNTSPTFKFALLNGDNVINTLEENIDFNRYTNETNYKVTLKIEDNVSSNELPSLYYFVGTSEPAKTADDHYSPVDNSGNIKTGWNSAKIMTIQNEAKAWKAEATISLSEDDIKDTDGNKISPRADGSYSIYIVAIDGAGNYSTVTANKSSDLKITPDYIQPTVENITANPGFVNKATYENLKNHSDTYKYKISAKVTDAPSGIEKVELWCDNAKLDLATPTPVADVYTFIVPTTVIETGIHTFTVKATDKAGNTKNVDSSQSFDITDPEVSISGIESQVTVSESGVDVDYVNGKIKISGTATDETKLGEGTIALGTAALTWNIDGDTTTAGCFGSVELSGISKNWKFEIDTTKVADGDHLVNVTVKDAADNVSTTETVTIKVKQSTDTPTLNITSADTTVTAYTSINDGVTNILATTGKLTGTISDDDGISTVKITVTPEGKSANTPITIDAGGKTNYSLNKALSDLGITAEGGYGIKIEVQDSKNETSVSSKTTNFVIAVDDADPVISEVTPSDGGYYKDNIAVAGKLKDASGKVTLVAAGNSTNYASAVEITGVATAQDFTDTIDISTLSDDVTDGYSVTYTATDKWGKTATKVVKYYVDKTKPIFKDADSGIKVNGSVVGGTANLTGKWFNGSALDILGYFTDAGGSGVETISYTVTKNDGTSIASSEISPAYGEYKIGGVANTKAFRYNSTISGFDECTATTPYTLSITAKDKAGNESIVAEQTILIDQTAPKAEVKFYSYDGGTTKSAVTGTVLSNGQKDLTLFGKVSDGLSGLDAVSFKLDTTTISSGIKYTTADLSDAATSYPTDPAEWQTYAPANANSYTGFMITIPKANLKSGSFSSTASDKAGNTTSLDSFTVVVDTEKPTISFTEITDADSDTLDTIDVNKDLVLSGIASDNYSLQAVNKVEYAVWNGTTYGAYTDYTTSAGLTGTYSWKTATIDTTAAPFDTLDKKKVKFRVTVVDTAENTNTAEKELYINQASDKPVITITSLDGTSDDIISTQTILGTIRDDDGVDTFKYSTDGTTWTSITITSGSWKIENLPAGQNTIYFQVKDKAGTTFTTADATDKPYIVFAGAPTTKVDSTAAVKFKIDLKAPTIKVMKVASTTTTTQLTADSKVGEEGSETSVWSDTLVSFGKDSKYMWIYAEVEEDVAVNTKSVNATTNIDATITVGETPFPTTTTIVRTGDVGTGKKLVYIIGPFDASSVSIEGTKTVTLTVTDKSGRTSSAKTATVYIDKTAPVVTVTAPNVTGGVSSEKDSIVGTTTIRGQITDSSNLSKFYYMIPDSTKKTTISAANYSFKASDGWINIADIEDSGVKINVIENRSSALWQIPVTSSAFTEPASGLSLIYYATAQKADKSLKYAETIAASTDVYVPIYFYAEDVTGQGEVTSVKLRVDPKGGIPSVNIITPEGFAKTGGNVNVQGIASDDAGDLDSVTIKIEISTTEITGADYTAKTTAAEAINNWVTVTKAALDETGVLTEGTADENGIITASKAGNFKFSVSLTEISDATLVSLIGSSGKDESNNDIPNEIKSVRITTVATDENGTTDNFSYSTLQKGDENYTYILVDKNAPTLSKLQLVQYTTAPTAGNVKSTTPSLSRAYTAGMYISESTGNGNWYLKGTVTDDAGVEGIKITSTGKYRALSGSISKNKTTGADDATNIICDGRGTKELTFIIPLNTTIGASGQAAKTQFYPTIELDDGQHTDVTSNLSINVDNTAPVLGTSITGNSGLQISEENVVENYDGSFSFSGTVTEAGSGLDFVAYYFIKNNGTIYNPSFSGSNSVATQSTAADGKVYINSEGLPAFYKTGVTRSAANKVSYTGLGSNEFIKQANVVKINGSYIRIASISGDEATLEKDADTSITTVEFIYAQIVDHNVTESITTDTATWPTGVSNDDGDGIAESVKQSGETYKWTSQIYSDRIDDGPVTIKFVVFDEAGNFDNSGSIKTSVANNRPRISKVYLATDFNGDGKFNYHSDIAGGAVNTIDEDKATENGYEFGELTFYSTLDKEGKVQGTATVKSTDANFVVTNNLLVMPEIIGGNVPTGKTLQYNYKVVDDLDAATITKKTAAEGETTPANVYRTLNNVLTGDDLQLTDYKRYVGTAADPSIADTANCESYETASLQTVAQLLGTNGKTNETNTLDTSKTPVAAGSTDDEKAKHTGGYKGVILSKSDLTAHESWTSEGGKNTKWFAFTFWDATPDTVQGDTSLFALLRLPIVVNVVDDVAPTATIKPFYWNSKSDSSFCYDDNDQPLGHIDIEANPTTATRPGVAGRVYIEGVANDETKLGSITVKAPKAGETDQEFVIAQYVNGAWVTGSDKDALGVEYKTTWNWPTNWKESEIWGEELSARKGHTVYWRVAIDMSKYGIVSNQVFEVTAADANSTPNVSTVADDTKQTVTGALTPRYIVNFVPYIKSIYPATASSANRSRLGKFPVQAGEDMIIEGMNFGTSGTATVYFWKSGTDMTNTANATSSVSGTVAADSTITVTAPNYSRYVSVKIGTSETKNNTNRNDGCNIEAGYNPKKADKGFADANKAGSNFWTDDRYISVWKVGTAFADSQNPNSGTLLKYEQAGKKQRSGDTDPVRAGDLVGIWSADNSQWDAILGNERYWGVAPTSSAGISVPPRSIDICLAKGKDIPDEYNYPFFTMLDNTYKDSTCGTGFEIFRDRATYSKNDGGKEGYTIDTQTSTTMYCDKFINPKINAVYCANENLAAQAIQNGSDGVFHVYVSYYDVFSHCLKYAAVQYAGKYTYDNCKLFYPDAAAYNTTVDVVVAGNNQASRTTSFTEEAGEWSDIELDITETSTIKKKVKDPDDQNKEIEVNADIYDIRPVIVFYNLTRRSLQIARGTKAVPNGKDDWNVITLSKPTGSNNFGQYVSMDMDDAGGLYIAAQDVSSGALCYTYISKASYSGLSTGTTLNVDWTKIDSVSNATWTDIKLTDKSKSGIEAGPIIAFKDSIQADLTLAARVAYPTTEKINNVDTIVWESLPDAAQYGVSGNKMSLAIDAYEGKSSSTKDHIAIGFNSNMFAVDFLRGEE